MKFRTALLAMAIMSAAALQLAPTTQAKSKQDTIKDDKPPEVYVIVKPGDTLSSIAEAHDTTYIKLFNANSDIVNPDLINVDEKIRIPTIDEKLEDRYSSVAPVAHISTFTTQSSSYTTPARPMARSSSAGNTYYYGYCTWYAKNRRPDLPNRLGNGGQWAANASAQGIATGSVPQVGAIAETYGHVAYVESVNGNGTITISEMNGPAGFGVVGTRTVPASQYWYIY